MMLQLGQQPGNLIKKLPAENSERKGFQFHVNIHVLKTSCGRDLLQEMWTIWFISRKELFLREWVLDTLPAAYDHMIRVIDLF